MYSSAYRLKLLFFACVTLSMCIVFLFISDSSQFDRSKRYQKRNEAVINQNKIKLGQLTSHYWGYGNIVDSMSPYYEMKYWQSIFHENSLPWENRSLLRQTNKSRYKAFDQKITPSDYLELVEILDVFQKSCFANNITFMMYGGSLLGSFRHFGFIPWDDDIDVLLNGTEKFRLLKLLRNMSSYVIDSPNKRQWKFYKKSKLCQTGLYMNRSVSRRCLRNINWPYIDIFFFSENDTHIWDEIPMYSASYVYTKREVFPLAESPFEKFILPVPKCPGKVLSKTYNIELCVTSTYSHKYEKLSEDRQLTVPCKRMYDLFPFVFETVFGEIVIRKLIFNDNIVYETVYKKENCS